MKNIMSLAFDDRSDRMVQLRNVKNKNMTQEKIKNIYALTWIILLMCSTVSFGQWSITGVTKLTDPVLQYQKAEFDIAVTGAFANPYEANDISIDMVLTSPSDKAIKLPCYYVSGNATASNWKARFAAREAGQYTYHFELKKLNVLEASSSNANFTSLATAMPGFLHKNNYWSFKFDNGQLFRGVGENFCWEPRLSEQGGYKGAYTYDYLLPKLAANGVNYFRVWMSPWNVPVQWKTVSNTTRYTNSNEYFNPSGSQRMDELVELSESLGLYFMLAMDYHGALSGEWNINNYNSANGGPISTPAEFFTNEAAKNMYKNRLRYLVARWGYSPSIGAWEFFNEVDNAMYTESNGNLPRIPDADVTAWHGEMSNYLKTIDPYEHLVTTSISHRAVTGMNDLPNIDFNQKHIYQDPYVGQIDTNISSGTSAHNKPYVIGEYGYRYQDDNYSAAYAFNWDYDFKQGLWLGLFKPTPILPLSWWWEMFDAKAGMTPYFKSVSEIYNSMMEAAGPSGDLAQPTASASALGQKVLAVRAGTKFYVYILNTTAAAVTTNITLATGKNGNYTVESFNPASGDNFTYTDKGTFTAASNNITITGNTIEAYKERILVLSEEGNTVGEQMPYDVAIPVPGKIEAEDFDKGGELISYHDLEATNTGTQYRNTEGVDIEVRTGGGFNVTNTVIGEWLEYTVNLDKSGTYSIAARVAADAAGKKFNLKIDGQSVSDVFEVPNTGGTQTWQTITLASELILKGTHVLRVTFESSEINLDYLDFTLSKEGPVVSLLKPSQDEEFKAPVTISLEAEASDADGSISKVEFYAGTTKLGEATTSPFKFDWKPTVGSYALHAVAIDNDGLAVPSADVNVVVLPSQTQMPFTDGGEPHVVPGIIQAEDVDQGVEGIAFHDLTNGNIKGQYRTDTSIDIESCTDTGGGYNLADIQNGEWVEYTIDVAETGKHNFSFRVATQVASQSFGMLIDEVSVASNINVPNTGGWQTWSTIKVSNVNLTAGQHVLRLAFASEFFNLNYINVEKINIVTAVEGDNMTRSVLYPNPAGESFSIKLLPSAQSLRIISAAGVEVYAQQNVDSINFTLTKKLTPGLYTIIIRHKLGNEEYIKAIIGQ
jgi:hypothetical protein